MKNFKTILRDACIRFSLFVAIGAASPGCGQGENGTSSARARPASDVQLAAATAQPSSAELARIQTYRDSLYMDSDIVYSFQSKFGATVDCIDFEAQGSVKALRAQGKATPFDKLGSLPSPPGGIAPPNGASDLAFQGEPDANGNPRRCPEGTVLSSRPTVAQILDAGGLDAFEAQRARLPQQSTEEYDCFYTTTGAAGFDHAAGYQHLNYAGLLKYTTLYGPSLANTSEHSISQLWAITGSCENWAPGQACTTGANGNAVQSVEVGWMVGNGNASQIPYLFAFVTLDGYLYGGKSCFAGQGTLQGGQPCCTASGTEGTDCWIANPNGAQFLVNEALGTAGSLPTGRAPVEMSFQVWNGTPYGANAWYVWINGSLIGGYLSSIFTGQMQTTGASYLQVGGEVYDSWPGNPGSHTTTQMGSGIPPAPSSGHGYEYTAYDRNVMYIDAQENYHNASLQYIQDTPAGEFDSTGVCGYQAGLFYALSTSQAAGGSGWGTYFYYGGGPGSF
jgi:hypothetical protein